MSGDDEYEVNMIGSFWQTCRSVPGPQASQDYFKEVGESRERIFLLPGHLAIQGGWSITAKTCRRLIQADTYVMRRPCSAHRGEQNE